MKDENKLFFLKMLYEFKNREIPLDIFTIQDKQHLISEDYIELTNLGYKLTEKGIEFISKVQEVKMVIKYPLTKSGRVGSYNKVLNTLSIKAANALMCAIVNSDFINKVDVSNIRVFIQHLIDNKNYHKWGEILIEKVHSELTQSKNFFSEKKKKQQYNV